MTSRRREKRSTGFEIPKDHFPVKEKTEAVLQRYFLLFFEELLIPDRLFGLDGGLRLAGCAAAAADPDDDEEEEEEEEEEGADRALDSSSSSNITPTSALMAFCALRCFSETHVKRSSRPRSAIVFRRRNTNCKKRASLFC
jgi:hypothetical protein